MNKWLFRQNGLFNQNGFTKTSLSATVTRVSNFVEENVCVFTSSRLLPMDSVVHCPTRQVKYVNHNALSMFKALNNGCSKNAQFYF